MVQKYNGILFFCIEKWKHSVNRKTDGIGNDIKQNKVGLGEANIKYFSDMQYSV